MLRLTPDSYLWKALEFYGVRVHHRGKWRLHEWVRSKLRLEPGADLEVQRDGLRWLLDPSDFVQSSFYWTGEFESWDWQNLARVVEPGSVVFDIGANFGYYALMLAHSKGAKVFAFEPSPPVLARLRTNIELNHLESSVTAVPLALSDRRGQAYLRLEEGNTGASTLCGAGEQVRGKREAVEMETMDGFCESHGISRVDVVKIDIEGHELHAIAGGQRTLERQPTLMIEFNHDALRAAGASVTELRDRLQALGYRLFLPGRKGLAAFDQELGPGEIVNLIALPAERARARTPGR